MSNQQRLEVRLILVGSAFAVWLGILALVSLANYLRFGEWIAGVLD